MLVILWVFVAVLVIILMILIHEAGHFLAAKTVGIKVDKFGIGFGPEIVGWTRGETRYSINWIIAGGYVKIAGMNPDDEIPPEDLPRSYRKAPYWKRLIVIIAGSFSHLLIALILFYLIFWPIGFPVLTGRVGKVQSKVTFSDGSSLPSPAYGIGLEKGDLIKSVNGVEIHEWADLTEQLSKNPGKVVTIEVERGKERFKRQVRLLDIEGRGILGIQVDLNDTFSRRTSPLKAFWDSGLTTAKLSVAFFKGIISLFSVKTLRVMIGVSPRTQESPRSIVGAAQLAVQAAKRGISDFLFIIAEIFLFLAIFNMIPLPPFDGGHVVVLIFEKFFKREVDLKKLMPIAWAVIVLLSIVAIRLAFLDIFKPIPPP